MYLLFRVFFQYVGNLLILALVSIILGNIAIAPSWGSAKNSPSVFITLKGENLSLKNIFSEISNRTGYRVIFDLDEQLENERFTFKWENESLVRALREIVKRAGIHNFVIVTDDKNQTLKVLNFDLLTSMRNLPVIQSDDTGLTLQQLKTLHEEQKKKIEMMNKNLDEIVIPPQGDHPGVTRGQLQALHERQNIEVARRANDPDAIAVPASKDYPAMTNRQLQELHKRQRDEIEKLEHMPNEIVIPRQGGQPSITRGQLQSLHESQKKAIESSTNNPDAIVVQASEDHPALTNRELQELHKQQKETIRNNQNKQMED
jgi:hypothetical protein